MNYSPLYSFTDIHFLRLRKRLLLSFLFGALAVLIFTNNASAQWTNWLYLATSTEGIKGYLKDDVKTLPNGNKTIWGKLIMTDGAFTISLTEWDCRNKLYITRQVTYYRADRSVIDTQTKPFEWGEIIPDSMGDFTYRRVCLPPRPMKWAQIIVARAKLRSLPDESYPALRIAKRGEKLQIVYEMAAEDGWFNVIDATGQQDYWLHGNTFKIVEDTNTKQKPAKKGKAPQPPITPKTKAKRGKNQRN